VFPHRVVLCLRPVSAERPALQGGGLTLPSKSSRRSEDFVLAGVVFPTVGYRLGTLVTLGVLLLSPQPLMAHRVQAKNGAPPHEQVVLVAIYLGNKLKSSRDARVPPNRTKGSRTGGPEARSYLPSYDTRGYILQFTRNTNLIFLSPSPLQYLLGPWPLLVTNNLDRVFPACPKLKRKQKATGATEQGSAKLSTSGQSAMPQANRRGARRPGAYFLPPSQLRYPSCTTRV